MSHSNISFIDLYGHAMRQTLPNGPGVCYERKANGFFDYKSMLTTTNFSLESIRWLSYMSTLEPYRGNYIHHALNTGEQKIEIQGRFYYVDGYCLIEDQQYFFEFDGCMYHHCTCDIARKSKFGKRDDTQKHSDLRKIGTLIVMKECEWKSFVKSNQPKYNLPNFFGRKNIKEQEIFDSVARGDFYGFLQCDLFSPDHVVEYFSKLNHPPIFNHVEIDEDMLSNKMIEKLRDRKSNFPLKKQLTLTFHANKYFLTQI